MILPRARGAMSKPGAAATNNERMCWCVALSGLIKTATLVTCGATCLSGPSNFAPRLRLHDREARQVAARITSQPSMVIVWRANGVLLPERCSRRARLAPVHTRVGNGHSRSAIPSQPPVRAGPVQQCLRTRARRGRAR